MLAFLVAFSVSFSFADGPVADGPPDLVATVSGAGPAPDRPIMLVTRFGIREIVTPATEIFDGDETSFGARFSTSTLPWDHLPHSYAIRGIGTHDLKIDDQIVLPGVHMTDCGCWPRAHHSSRYRLWPAAVALVGVLALLELVRRGTKTPRTPPG